MLQTKFIQFVKLDNWTNFERWAYFKLYVRYENVILYETVIFEESQIELFMWNVWEPLVIPYIAC